MNKGIRNNIAEWQHLTEQVTEKFLFDYFDDVEPVFDWVGNEVGGILMYGDYFFNFSDILICYKLNITKEQLLNWYDFCLTSQPVNISLAQFILSPEEKDKKQKEYLEILKNNVTFAEETLKKAVEDYENKN